MEEYNGLKIPDREKNQLEINQNDYCANALCVDIKDCKDCVFHESNIYFFREYLDEVNTRGGYED